MTADRPESDLQYGDSGDAVLWLQHRLHALGLLADRPDGHFDDATAAALQALATAQGLSLDEHWVDSQFWGALATAEAATGLQSGSSDAWQWDGQSWQPAAGAAHDVAVADATPVDATGQWVWDGTTWQPAS
jgi:peptidoglycan hydrolase-like protein with peptidoglycan-binding domain